MVVVRIVDMILPPFLSIVSSKFNIVIDRMIRSHVHGKVLVDGINICEKIII